MLEVSYLAPFPILTGLIVELLFLLYACNIPLGKAALVNVIMNTSSAIAGAILIPMAGFIWAFFPGILISRQFGLGAFDLLSWLAAVIFAISSHTLVEGYVIRKMAHRLFAGRMLFLLALANTISVGVAFLGGQGVS